MPHPLVYTIVLNWNRPALTIDCLHSLELLDYPNHRVLVVDNGSSDDSVARISGEFPHLEMLRTGTNLGFGAGNNCGIKRAFERGAEYVWLLNNDTQVFAETLTRPVAKAQENATYGAVGSVLLYSRDPERVQAWGGGNINLFTGRARHFRTRSPLGPRAFLTAASLLVRADAIKAVNLFDEGFFLYWEDADLCYRIRKAGYRLTVAADAKLLHLESATLRMNSPLRLFHSARSTKRFFYRHSGVPLIPVAISLSLRVAKRLVRGRWNEASALVRGSLGSRRS
ncbi:MAG: glycosyltransferase family 2 protein [Bryobacteraceae bacterium]